MGIKAKRKIKNYLGRDFKRERNPDKQSPASRSSQMSKIRSKDTRFEKAFIKLLKEEFGGSFVTHVASIRGKPDIVFEKQKLCIFLDSDFWHGWQFPRWKHLMKNDFWVNKITNNRKRDLKTKRILKKNGWMVIRIWEHQIKQDPQKSIQKIKDTFRQII